MNWIKRRRIADYEWRMERDTAENVECPECHAQPREHCRNLTDGGELGRIPAHWRRIRAAELEAT